MTAIDTYLLLRAFCDELARCGLRARLHLARVAQHPDRALAGPRAADPLLVAHRRALRRLLRPRRGQGVGPPGRARLHVGHRGGELRAGGDRGAPGAGAADRADRRSAARAARRRRRPDDRPAQALRRRRQVVRRGRRARGRRPETLRWIRALACRAYWTAPQGLPGPCTSTSPCASRWCSRTAARGAAPAAPASGPMSSSTPPRAPARRPAAAIRSAGS